MISVLDFHSNDFCIPTFMIDNENSSNSKVIEPVNLTTTMGLSENITLDD